jgi:3-methyladenine DNA glycosylase/8-oxoguanine DNA glycosylase
LVPGETKERRESSNSTNKNDAIRLLNSRRKEIDNGRMVPAAVTIADLLDLYLADKKSKKSGYGTRKSNVRVHLRPAFGRTQPRDFTTRLISNVVEQKKSLGRANASINRWLEALHRAFTLGYQNRPRLVPEIPQIPMLDETDNVREGLLSHADYVKLREELPAH